MVQIMAQGCRSPAQLGSEDAQALTDVISLGSGSRGVRTGVRLRSLTIPTVAGIPMETMQLSKAYPVDQNQVPNPRALLVLPGLILPLWL